MEQEWRWKNCRDFGLSISLWPFNWTRPVFEKSGDVYGAKYRFQIGPIDLALDVNDGSWRGMRREEEDIE